MPRPVINHQIISFLKERKKNPVRTTKPLGPGKLSLSKIKEERMLKLAKLHDAGQKNKHTTASKYNLEILDLLKKFKGHSFDGVDLLGSIVASHGTSQKALLPYANAINNLHLLMKKHGTSPITIDPINIARVVSSNALQKTFELARKTKKPISVNDLLKQNPSLSVSNIMYSFQVLEEAGLVVGLLPEGGKKSGGPETKYIIATHKTSPLTIPKRNNSFNILMALSKGSKSILEMSTTQKIGRVNIGSKDGVANSTRVRFALDDLILRDLVKMEVDSDKKTSKKIYSLTKKGEQLVKEQKKKEHLHQPLRRAILTHIPKQTQLKPSQRVNLDRLQRTVEVILDYENSPKNKKGQLQSGARIQIAKKHGIATSTVGDILRGAITPWTNLTYESLVGIYLPELEKRNPKAYGWLSKYVREHKDEFSKRTTKIKKRIPSTKQFEKRNPGFENDAKRFRSQQGINDEAFNSLTNHFNSVVNSDKRLPNRLTSNHYDYLTKEILKRTSVHYRKVYAFVQFMIGHQ